MKALGAAVLTAMEKQDAEELSLLRSEHEMRLLDMVTIVKEQQMKDAAANLDVLNQSFAQALDRFAQYQKLLGNNAIAFDSSGLPRMETSSTLQVAASASGSTTGLGLIQNEIDQLSSQETANQLMIAAGINSSIAGTLHLIPNMQGGSMFLSTITGRIVLGLGRRRDHHAPEHAVQQRQLRGEPQGAVRRIPAAAGR